jgi:hypothetical protein
MLAADSTYFCIKIIHMHSKTYRKIYCNEGNLHDALEFKIIDETRPVSFIKNSVFKILYRASLIFLFSLYLMVYPFREIVQFVVAIIKRGHEKGESDYVLTLQFPGQSMA